MHATNRRNGVASVDAPLPARAVHGAIDRGNSCRVVRPCLVVIRHIAALHPSLMAHLIHASRVVAPCQTVGRVEGRRAQRRIERPLGLARQRHAGLEAAAPGIRARGIGRAIRRRCVVEIHIVLLLAHYEERCGCSGYVLARVGRQMQEARAVRESARVMQAWKGRSINNKLASRVGEIECIVPCLVSLSSGRAGFSETGCEEHAGSRGVARCGKSLQVSLVARELYSVGWLLFGTPQ